ASRHCKKIERLVLRDIAAAALYVGASIQLQPSRCDIVRCRIGTQSVCQIQRQIVCRTDEDGMGKTGTTCRLIVKLLHIKICCATPVTDLRQVEIPIALAIKSSCREITVTHEYNNRIAYCCSAVCAECPKTECARNKIAGTDVVGRRHRGNVADDPSGACKRALHLSIFMVSCLTCRA